MMQETSLKIGVFTSAGRSMVPWGLSYRDPCHDFGGSSLRDQPNLVKSSPAVGIPVKRTEFIRLTPWENGS